MLLSGVGNRQQNEPSIPVIELDDPVAQRLPQVRAGIRQSPVGLDRVFPLPLLGRVVGLGMMKNDVVERLEAQREVIFIVHPLQRRQ